MLRHLCVFFFKQKTAYEMRISDWSSDVCSSDLMKRRNVLDGVNVERVVFNEITKKAVVEAFQHPRSLNQELIDAYMARRALDYLVGFTLSPVLWRKLPGSRSAGRVHSVALRLICEREAEFAALRASEYWSLAVNLETVEGAPRSEARGVGREGVRRGRRGWEKYI